MIYGVLADLVLVAHLTFILFVLTGGLLALRWKRAVWLHLPAALWGVLIEIAGWICPLTPLENYLRSRAGELGFDGTFVEHYLLPVVYPEGLTRNVQLVLAAVVLAMNVAVYAVVLRRPTKAFFRRLASLRYSTSRRE